MLRQAEAKHGDDVEVSLISEDDVMEQGYEESLARSVTDIRLDHDWPLPGESLMVTEIERKPRMLIFYSKSSLPLHGFRSYVK